MNAVSAPAGKGFRSRIAIRLAASAACAALGLIAVQANANIGGFTTSDFTLNGNTEATAGGVPSIDDLTQTLKATTNTNGNATSAFFITPQSITNFTASYLYDMGLSTANPADGVAFVLQNDPRGGTALGDGGGGLGYTGGNGVNNSVALSLDIWNGGNAANPTRAGIGMNRAGFSYVPTTPVNLRTNPVRVDIAYRDGIFTQTLTDTVTNATSTQQFFGDVALITGSNTGFVGFTGGTGGANAEQFISNFNYIEGNAPVPTTPTRATLIPNMPSGGMGFMGVREVTGAGNMGNLQQAEAGVTGSAGTRVDYTAPVINILDTGNPGDFTAPLNPDDPYRSNGADVGGADQINNIAVVATGVVRVPTTGNYTFGVSSDDGFRLTVEGQNFAAATNATISSGGALEFTGGRGADNVSLGTIHLTAGDHPIQLLNWEGGGGASVELISAQGHHTSLNNSFNLVGAPEQTVTRRAGTISPAGFAVHSFNGLTDPDGAGPLTTLDDAISRHNALQTDPNAHNGQRLGDPTVFMSDPEGRGANRNNQFDFGPDRPFPNDTAAAEDNFGTSATGELTITTAGVYTFDVLADDLFRFRLTDSSGNDVDLLGMGASVIGQNTDADAADDAFRSTGCCTDRFGFYDLAAGTYDIEVIMQEGGGGASFALFGAFGQWNGFDPLLFQLVGQNIDTTATRPAGLQLVPEPGTFAMLGIAGLGILARRRRR